MQWLCRLAGALPLVALCSVSSSRMIAADRLEAGLGIAGAEKQGDGLKKAEP